MTARTVPPSQLATGPRPGPDHSHLPPPPPSPPGWAPPPPGWAPPPPPGWPPPPPAGGWRPATPSGGRRGGLQLQDLLLGLGTGLVAVAALVFVAVTWDQLDAAVQAAVLVAVTSVAVVSCRHAARRSMPSTAEAVGLVAVLLALVDAHALRIALAPGVPASAWWGGALAAVAAGAWLLGAGTQVRSTRLAAVVLGQASLPVFLTEWDVPPAIARVLLLVQAGTVLALAVTAHRSPRVVRSTAALVALVTWALTTFASWVVALADGDTRRLEGAMVLAVAAAVPLALAVLCRERGDLRRLGLLAGSVIAWVAAVLAATAVVEERWLPAATAVAAVAVAVVAWRAPTRWGLVPASVTSGVLVLASLPFGLAVLGAASVAFDGAALPWQGDPGAVAVRTDAAGPGWLDPGPLAVHLAALAGAAVGIGSLAGRRTVAVGLAVVATAAVVVAPVALPLSVGGAAAVAWIGAAAATAALVAAGPRRWAADTAAAVGAVLASVGTAWALADRAWTLVASIAVAAIAAAWAVTGRDRDQAHLALVGSGAGVVAVGAAAGVVAAIAGIGGPACVVIASAASAAVALLVALLVDPPGRRRDLDGALSAVADAAALAVHLPALTVAAGSDATLGWALATGVAAASLTAARPGRRGAAALAVGEALALVWLQLHLAGVEAVEAYTLPVAVVLLGAGAWAERRAAGRGEALASWTAWGPGLVVGLAPTVLLALGDPGSLRPLAGLVAGATVLAAGAVTGRRAAVDVGTAAVVLLAVRHLGPVASELPAWITLGCTGGALLAVGATFEQRRRDLHEVRDRYRSLR